MQQISNAMTDFGPTADLSVDPVVEESIHLEGSPGS
jgi:hypothetical protein